MPTKTIIQTMQVILDPNERIVDYRFSRPTCRGGVSDDSILLEFFRERPFADILSLDVDRFCQVFPAPDSWHQYLFLKHFIALQSVLRVYTGAQAGGIEDFCTISEIRTEDRFVTIEALIALDIMTKRIATCRDCPGCRNNSSVGSRKRPS